MSKSDIVALFFQNTENLTPLRMLLVLLCTFAASLLIYFIYRITARGDGYSESFNQGNILLALLTSVIMMLISTNIAVSLGMVGALSIIRFRTAVKNPRDTLFLFWAIVIGLCVGCQYYILAVIADLVLAAVLLVMYFIRQRGKENYTLLVCCDNISRLDAIRTVLSSQTCFSRILATNCSDGNCELVLSLSGTEDNCTQVVAAIIALDGVCSASLTGSEHAY